MTTKQDEADLLNTWLKLDQLAACSALSPLQRQIIAQLRAGWTLDEDQRHYVEHLHRLVVRPQTTK